MDFIFAANCGWPLTKNRDLSVKENLPAHTYSEMKSIVLILLSLFIFQLNAQERLNAEESDPRKMEWMRGFPPHQDSIVSAIDGSFFRFPAMRYSVCHMREFMPTKVVSASTNNRHAFRKMPDENIDSISFMPWNSSELMTWEQSLTENYTDGILILHQGTIVYERYFGELEPEGVHAAMSVSKTFTGTLGALLVEEGILDENKTGSDYIPELAHSAFGDATLRQILDMTTGLKYSEDYSDPNAEIWAFSAAGNPFPKPKSYTGPTNYYDYLVTVQKEGQHGEVFGYKTINTDALGWIISRVTGKSIPELLSERIWKPLGTQKDGYFQIDGAGIAFAGGGLSANMRDMARFGEMIRNKGKFNEQQILPPSLIEDIMSGGSQKAFSNSAYGATLEGWSYRNMWWILHNEHGAIAARGVYGQTIYIDPKAEMVIVRFASHPEAKNSKIDPTSLPAYQAVAEYLIKTKDKFASMTRKWFDQENYTALEIIEWKDLRSRKVVAQVYIEDEHFIQRLKERIEQIPTEGDMMISWSVKARQIALVFSNEDTEKQHDIYESSLQTPSTGFHHKTEKREAQIVADVRALLHPELGKPVPVVRNLALDFGTFVLTYAGSDDLTPQGTTLSLTKRSFTVKSASTGASRTIEIHHGQRPPEPVKFTIDEREFVLYSFEDKDKKRLYPDYFVIDRVE